jgi:His Kinase A (phospho-acceptor) domain
MNGWREIGARRRAAGTSLDTMLEQTDSAAQRPIEGVRSRLPPERGRSASRRGPLVGEVNGVAGGRRTLGARGLPGLASARLSHELRTPLNAILGNTELLLDGSAGPLSGQARACLGDIQAAGQRMLRQVQVLLELCDARAQPTVTRDAAIDLIELLRAANATAPALEPARALEVVPASARFVVRGDAAWLGALAVALVEVHRGDGQMCEPLRVTMGGRPPAAEGGVLCLWWRHFDPNQVAALPIALIDAILNLHGGDAALTGDGLQLDWPAARVVQVGPAVAGQRRDRNGA